MDTELNGLDIEAQHCLVEHVEGKVYLTPLAGATSVNSDGITCKTKLTHGNTVLLFTESQSYMFCIFTVTDILCY